MRNRRSSKGLVRSRSVAGTHPANADGVTRVKEFYDRDGWRWVDGQSGDARRWGTEPRGPVQAQLARFRLELLRTELGLQGHESGRDVSLVEFGGGGQPAVQLLDAVRRYTAVDISGEGLKAAASALEPLGLETRFVEADVRSLPLDDDQFDVAYSAHMIYHLPTADDQRRALQEMARVVRPGGALAVVGANPYPLLFPGRCVRRAVADTPVLGPLVRALRPVPPLPYLPMSRRWRSSVLSPFGAVSAHPFGVPTPSFSRRVDESAASGRLLWRGIAALETGYPRLALRLGSFTVVILRKGA